MRAMGRGEHVVNTSGAKKRFEHCRNVPNHWRLRQALGALTLEPNVASIICRHEENQQNRQKRRHGDEGRTGQGSQRCWSNGECGLSPIHCRGMGEEGPGLP
jgi:hypothetical protein